MTIRPAVEDDVPAVVVLAGHAAVAQGQPTPDRDRLLTLIHGLMADSAGALFVMKDKAVVDLLTPAARRVRAGDARVREAS